MLNKSCNRTHWFFITGVSGAVTNVRVRIWSTAADPAHSRQADLTGRVYWQGALRRSVARGLAWREHRCQNILLSGRGLVE